MERERTRSKKNSLQGEKRLRNNKVATRIVYAVGLLCRGIQGDRKKGEHRVVASTVTLVVADTYTVRAVVYNDESFAQIVSFLSDFAFTLFLAFKFFKKVSRFEIKSISVRKRDGNGKLALLLFPFFFFCCRSLQRDRTHFSPLPLSCVHRLEAKREGPIHRLYFFNLFSPSHKSQSASSEITYCVVH